MRTSFPKVLVKWLLYLVILGVIYYRVRWGWGVGGYLVVLFHLGTVSSRWGWFGGVEEESLVGCIFPWGVFLPGLKYPCPELLWVDISWVRSLSWVFLRGPPLQEVASLGGNSYPILAYDPFGFFL